MSSFRAQLDVLENFHGHQSPSWPVDPYDFLIWWHCGYPASDASCAKGWKSLQERVGVTPKELLQVKPSNLTKALKAGGLIPELRTERLRSIATVIQRDFDGNLARGLLHMPPAEIRRTLKRLPGIADPGADRIMLFGGFCAVAAVPSNATQVPLRMQLGAVGNSYAQDYLEGQRLIDTRVAPTLEARQRAFLLLKIHGQSLCKRSNPNCDACPIVTGCAFGSGATAGKAN